MMTPKMRLLPLLWVLRKYFGRYYIPPTSSISCTENRACSLLNVWNLVRSGMRDHSNEWAQTLGPLCRRSRIRQGGRTAVAALMLRPAQAAIRSELSRLSPSQLHG